MVRLRERRFEGERTNIRYDEVTEATGEPESEQPTMGQSGIRAVYKKKKTRAFYVWYNRGAIYINDQKSPKLFDMWSTNFNKFMT